jgi:hypothetical protein
VGQVLGNRALVAAKTDITVRAYEVGGRCRAITLRDYTLAIDIIAARCPGRDDAMRCEDGVRIAGRSRRQDRGAVA